MKPIKDLELQQLAKDLTFISQKIYLMATGDSRIPTTQEYKIMLVERLRKAAEDLEKMYEPS